MPSVTETSSAAAAAQAVSKTNLSVRRYRKSVTGLTAAELTALRSALTRMIALSDDRGFGYWADPAGLFGQAVSVKSRRARWLDRVRSRGWPVQ